MNITKDSITCDCGMHFDLKRDKDLRPLERLLTAANEAKGSALLACYPSYYEEIKPLLRFYQAEDLPELIREMDAHIARLQNRVTELVNPDVIMQTPREG